MRLYVTFVSVLYLFSPVFALTALGNDKLDAEARSVHTPPIPDACNPSAEGKDIVDLQYAALGDFVHLLWRKQDPDTAFGRYVPGNYTQHAPTFPQGSAYVVQYLTDLFTSPEGVKSSNITILAGQGYGMVHHKMTLVDTTLAIVNYYKFHGTCLIENWEVVQQIFGNEPNPIAFF